MKRPVSYPATSRPPPPLLPPASLGGRRGRAAGRAARAPAPGGPVPQFPRGTGRPCPLPAPPAARDCAAPLLRSIPAAPAAPAATTTCHHHVPGAGPTSCGSAAAAAARRKKKPKTSLKKRKTALKKKSSAVAQPAAPLTRSLFTHLRLRLRAPAAGGCYCLVVGCAASGGTALAQLVSCSSVRSAAAALLSNCCCGCCCCSCGASAAALAEQVRLPLPLPCQVAWPLPGEAEGAGGRGRCCCCCSYGGCGCRPRSTPRGHVTSVEPSSKRQSRGVVVLPQGGARQNRNCESIGTILSLSWKLCCARDRRAAARVGASHYKRARVLAPTTQRASSATRAFLLS
jgi:hypothetical protein